LHNNALFEENATVLKSLIALWEAPARLASFCTSTSTHEVPRGLRHANID